MEIKDLLIFQSVARNGSISKAADELCYVQSHVTARIKSLESKLKTQLFDRHSRGTTLNTEGKRLLVYTEKILFLIEKVNKEFQDSANPSGALEIGTVETIMKLPMILSTYHKNHPNVDLTLKTGVSTDLINQVLKRKLDGAFVTGFGNHPEIEKVEVFQEELVLISGSKRISYDNLKNKPLLVFNSGCSYRARLENWLYDEGIINAKVMEFGTLETILGSVTAGLGISLVPYSTVSHLEADGIIQCYPIPKKYSDISIVFIRQVDDYLTSTMKKFIDTINQVTNEPHLMTLKPIINVFDHEKYPVEN
ncbi:LysR family transcriptional regulator [Oceanobacillus polygoni]|uniref:DNA-binding transcriptional LysR family regulator n=1 Tax=Oceanobacillus polygoni TaxID=1235259 RepID=A0A9X0YP26_9BACI|nr:LysR family transcriptional regulator [Oceanobacillus polygoni]MBP2076113.1 DNA-binding transcriptional LysR family regulator [Oceanobacillus polygoni]